MNLSESYKARIIGTLIYNERKAKRKSAETVAALAGLSQQYLSEIERGKKNLPFSSITSIFQVLSIPFDESQELVCHADELLDDAVLSYIAFEKEKTFFCLKQLTAETYKHSYAYLYYQIAVIMQNYLIKNAFPANSKHIEQLLSITDGKLLALLYFLLGNAGQKINLHQAKEYTTSGLQMISHFSSELCFSALHCLLLEQLSTLEETSNRLFDSLSLNKQALQIANENYFIPFSLSLEINLANLYSKMGQFKLSTEQNKKIIRISQNIKMKQIENAAKFNLASNYLVAGKYQSCISTALSIIYLAEQNTSFLPLYYLLAFSYLAIGDRNATQKYTDLLISKPGKDSFMEQIYFLLQDILHNKPVIPQLLSLFDFVLQNGDRSDVEIIFRVLVSHLKKENCTDTLITSYEKYINSFSYYNGLQNITLE